MSESLQLESIHLRVHDLGRSVEFYTRRLGFVLQPAPASNAHASLGLTAEAPPLLHLTEDAPAPPRDAAGLFHAALLFPTRAVLGRWLADAAKRDVAFDGFSDHGVSEALYFSDPDGNGLEFYADRPHRAWPFRNGKLAMTTAPLDVRDLLSAASTLPATVPASPPPLPASPPTPLAGARWGHLHLRASNLERSAEFYTRTLGLSLTQRFGANALFLAAGGYHHHLGLNNWAGVRRPQPPDALGLIETTFSAAAASAPRSVRDPDGIALQLQPREVASNDPGGKTALRDAARAPCPRRSSCPRS